MPMYIKTPPEFIDPVTQQPMPDAVLEIVDVELRLRAGDVRVTACLYASVELMEDVQAEPHNERVLAALSMEEIERVAPALVEALYNVLIERPAIEGAVLVGGSPEAGAYTSTWTWDASSGTFHRGELRSDTTAWQTATQLVLSTFPATAGGELAPDTLASFLKAGNRIQLQSKLDATIRALYDITADGQPGSTPESYEVSVAYRDGSGNTPADGKDTFVTILT